MDIIGVAILDEYWDIKSANDAFFSFVGGSEYQSLIKLIKKNEVERFLNLFKNLDEQDVGQGVFNLLSYDGNYYPVLLKVSFSDKDKNYYQIKLWEINKSEEVYNNVLFREKKLRAVLTAGNDITFEYTPSTDNFRLFVFNGGTELITYNDTLENWKNTAYENNYIDKNSKTQFEKFYNELKSQNVQSEYCFEGSIFSNGNKKQKINCYCCKVEQEKMDTVIVGVIKAYSDSDLQNESILFTEVSTDFLTGTLNKKAIRKYIEEKINKSPKFKMSLAIIDVDNFKDVNDNLGHLFGDEVLVRIAQIIMALVGDTGTVGRIGGDEFLVLFENVKSLMKLRGILRAIRSSVESEFSMNFKEKNLPENVKISLSIGVAQYPDNGTTYDELFKIADRSLYIAKGKGKNRYIIYNKELHGDYEIEEDSVSIGRRRESRHCTDFLCEFINKINIDGERSIPELLKKMKTVFNLGAINLFYGSDFKIKYSSEENFDKNKKADFMLNNDFTQEFSTNGQFLINHIERVGVSFNDVNKFYSQQNVFAVVLCFIGDKNNIRGVISFEVIGKFRRWSNEEISDFAVIGRILSSII